MQREILTGIWRLVPVLPKTDLYGNLGTGLIQSADNSYIIDGLITKHCRHYITLHHIPDTGDAVYLVSIHYKSNAEVTSNFPGKTCQSVSVY